ncbi:hypothetical protein CCM_06367 [Cordyceps militaris CM01]|uniref:Uncharacterized protein n=1 Tax=Cordyceps militaris (strain CM01) TaxID=983644 RepID=G3JKC8_CORMM|nr:uncharacterized protein CCM_06367 [Cordyceps militaris CM01]EGX92206.1 hypothetical protein CCM_06367 [Cordyceps militaris CM01]
MAGGTQRQPIATGNGVLFEVVLKNADPRKKPTHGLSLSYGGQMYSWPGAAVSMGSVHTVDTDDDENPSEPRGQEKRRSRDSCPSRCLKKSPGRSAQKEAAPVLTASPKKLRRSRTLSPSHQSRTRALFAPLSALSRKLSARRHSYDEDEKTKREKRQEKTTPPPEQRPAVRTLPQGFFPPPHVAYQNPVPMYHHVPAPVFATAPIQYPTAQGTSSTAPQCPPELQQLQGRINHFAAVLAANPIDLLAKRELDRLTAERNSFLDTATKSTVPAAPLAPIKEVRPTTDSIPSIAQQQPVVHNPVSHESTAVSASYAPRDMTASPEQQHICSGCGEMRSLSFHRKHPFAKPVHNVCRKCREGGRRRRAAPPVMSRYHFCDGCGIVRSKEYHRRRGSANTTSVSMRSKICRKCHADGHHQRQTPDKTAREYKSLTKDGKHSESVALKPASRKEPLAEPSTARRKQPHGCEDDLGIPVYDGVSDWHSSTPMSAETNTTSYPCARDDAFATYRSPEVSEEDASSHQPASLQSSFRSSGRDSPAFRDYTAPEASLTDAASETSSLHTPQDTNPCSSTNPYYQPRGTTGRLSSPFLYAEPRAPQPSAVRPSSPRDPASPPSAPRSGINSPPRRFVDRNQSWPGNLHLPRGSPTYTTTRKVSASDGAPSPTFLDPARFTTGAFSSKRRPPSSSPPASPWASFSGPIPHPGGSEPGSKGKSVFARYHNNNNTPTASEPAVSPIADHHPAFPGRFRRPKSFSGRDPATSASGGTEFASTRGAWNINTRGGGQDEHVPEPIIEEPSSPLAKSPVTTPLLLEFHLEEDLSDSGVEFLTGSSSPSCLSGDDNSSLLASHLAVL